MTNSIFYDKNSRYNNLNNDSIIFLTPLQLRDLDVGVDMSNFHEDEFNRIVPIVVDSLKEMVKETTIGEQNGSSVTYSVENSDCKAYLCIEINGILCKVQSEEVQSGYIPLNNQVKLFQRLISEGQITLEDVAAEDVDNDVYKKLVVNDLNGAELCRSKLEKIDYWVSEQSKDDLMNKRKEIVIKSL